MYSPRWLSPLWKTLSTLLDNLPPGREVCPHHLTTHLGLPAGDPYPPANGREKKPPSPPKEIRPPAPDLSSSGQSLINETPPGTANLHESLPSRALFSDPVYPFPLDRLLPFHFFVNISSPTTPIKTEGRSLGAASFHKARCH